MHAITLWANQESAPTRLDTANHMENNGGWMAVGTSLPPPRQAPVAFTRSARHHWKGSLNPRLDVRSRDSWW
jgi:hypothetical protein